MAKKDVFNGAKAGLRIYDVFVQAVAEEIGMERTLALINKVMEKGGTNTGNAMKKQAGIKKFDAKTALPLWKITPDNLGLSVKIVEESPERVFMKCTKCSVYDAAHELGMDNKTIESLCQVGGIKFTDAIVKQLNPNLTYRVVKFRSSPDDFCEEEIVLE